MSRTDVINFFIKRYGYKTYLEIGVADVNFNFSFVQAEDKIWVDPAPPYAPDDNYRMTSDEFFKQNKRTFDVIFIDGYHEETQVYRDIINSINALNDGGVVIMHDCNPTEEIIQAKSPQQPGAWTGDCWRAFVRFRQETTDYNMFVINTDWGMGVIKKSNIKLKPFIITEPITYSNLDKYRKEWLNLIEIEDIANMLNHE